jgi:hypothetical protein
MKELFNLGLYYSFNQAFYEKALQSQNQTVPCAQTLLILGPRGVTSVFLTIFEAIVPY